jgi:CubicO group peptidase (beta-lactamase class C family)
MSYGDFLRKKIFEPLGMTNTSHHYLAGDIIKNAATGYTDDGPNDLKRASYVDWTSKTGNGSLYSTAEDLYRFCKSFSTDKLLTKSSRDKMFTNHISNTGYGWFLRPDKDKRRMYINGRSPGFTAFMMIYPDDDLYIIILNNLYIPVPTTMGNDIASIIFGRPITKIELSSEKLSPDLIFNAVGKYQFDSSFFRPNYILEVSEKNGRLTTSFGGLTHNGKDSFILRSFWADLKFERNSNGVITGLDYDVDKAKRIN